MTERGAPALVRGIGRWGLVALTVNCVVGAGILGLPGKVYALAGNLTGWVIAGAALLATAAALCLAELGSRFDGTGGPALYCREAFGPWGGFVAGWLLWTATVLGAASLLNLFAGLVWPEQRIAIVIALGAAMTAVTLIGIAGSNAASTLLTLLKLSLLVGFVAIGLHAPAAAAIPPPGPLDPTGAIVLLFFAFVGFERPTAVAGEVADARRAMPFALVSGMAVVTLLYSAIFAVCLRSVPDLATSAQPVRDLAGRILAGKVGGALTGAAAAIILGTIATQWITAPRVVLALAQAGQLPAILTRVSGRRGTPDWAILLTGTASIILALTGEFVATVTASSASRLMIFIACAAAMIRLRKGARKSRARFRLPAGVAVAMVVIAACISLLASAAAELAQLALILSFGVSLCLISTRLRSG
jgi:basic amino acid/polyamine antiporter, APA family